MRTRLGSLTGLTGLTSLATLTLAAALRAPAPPAAADPPGFGGEHPVTELTGQYDLPRTEKREDLISVSKYGLRFVGGGAGNRLTVTEVGDQVRYVDRAANRWKSLPSVCRRIKVPQGIGAQCRVPAKFKDGRMFLEVYPRLGNDHVDGHTLSGRHRMWVLVDAGNDVVSMGAGSDFANGAFDDDTISGGGGNDWIRAGKGSNRVFGGAGNDELAGGDETDLISGGDGNDKVSGGPGNDRLRGDAGADKIGGGPGRDVAVRDGSDTVYQCEVVRS